MLKNIHRLYQLWLVLLLLSGGITLWFTGAALVDIYQYYILNERAPVEVLRWQVRERSPSQFAIEAEYEFRVKEVTYHGKTQLQNPQFLNRYAAESHIAKLGSPQETIWYQKSNPLHSSMEKEFPRKELTQALLTLGVFLYFLFARDKILRTLTQLS